MEEEDSNVTFTALYFAVIFESFIWGLGTAVGELPPYYIAKIAAATNDEYPSDKLDSVLREQEGEEYNKTTYAGYLIR